MKNILLICVIAGSLSVAYGQQPDPDRAPVPQISPPLHVPLLDKVPSADRVFYSASTARIAAPAEVIGEKTDHLLKAAAHLEAAGRADEARQFRQEAQQIKDSLAKRLAVLEDEVRRIRRLIGPVPSVILEVEVVELPRDRIEKLGIDFAAFKLPSQVADADSAVLKTLAKLKKDRLLRTRCEPTLVALSGQRVEFSRGGEFPYPALQDDGTVTIEYKEFGTRVELLPTVLDKGDVRLEMRVRLSELNSKLDVRAGKLRCPGLAIREVRTGVRMQADQTLIVGGMSQIRTSRKTAAGESSDTREQVEILVLVTPRIVDSPAAVSARTPVSK